MSDANWVDGTASLYSSRGQGHVVAPLLAPDADVTENEKSQLKAQLGNIDLDSFLKLHAASTQPCHDENGDDDNISPVPVEMVSDATAHTERVDSWRALGMDVIRAGKVAAMVVAGGQGTRLGYAGPKGAFNIGLLSGKTLFELHCQRIVKLCLDAGKSDAIPLYVMTSPLNDASTREHFESNGFFGMQRSNVFFFPQGTLPCVSNEGKIIMKGKSEIATAPDGNGGCYRALQKSGALADMKARGVEYLHAYAVDNALVQPADPVFMGCCIQKGADVGNLACPKASWDERVGVMAMRNGKYHVVEYSEIDEKRAKQTDPVTGKLLYSAGNICNHWYTVSWLESVAIPNALGIHHVARKKIPYWDSNSNQTVTPTSPNGIKLEKFIFDVFPLSQKMALLEVSRASTFSPVKNAKGKDSPATARNMIYELHKSFLRRAGATVVGDQFEISPLVAYSCGDNLSADDATLKNLSKHVHGKTLSAPLLICAQSEADGYASVDAEVLAIDVSRNML